MSRHALLLIHAWLAKVLFLQFEPLNDVDIHWQVRLGQLALEQGQLITSDPFTFTHADEPVPTIGWLAQIIFAALYDVGSWRAVQIVHLMMFGGALVLSGWTAVVECRRKNLPLGMFSLVAAVTLAFIVSASNSMVRPQSFGLLCFSLLLYVVRNEWRWPVKFAAAVPILLFWQNTHPSVVLGAVAVAGLAGAAWLVWFIRRDTPIPLGLTGMVVLAALAQLATPMGWHVFETSAANLHISRDVLGVTEWLPAWSATIRQAMLGFAVAMVISIALLARLGRRVELKALVLFVGFAILACSAARFAIFWALAMIPAWAVWIEQAKPKAMFMWCGEYPVRRATVTTVLLCGGALALAGPSTLQSSVKDEFALAEGLVQLRSALPQGRIYNYREWGGPLILAGHPDWRVAIDGRLYLYGESDWQRYNLAALGRVPLAELVEQYQPDAFFLKPSFHENLIELLHQSAQWRESYSDDNCAVFVKSP